MENRVVGKGEKKIKERKKTERLEKKFKEKRKKESVIKKERVSD